jgi:hypothetical protein
MRFVNFDIRLLGAQIASGAKARIFSSEFGTTEVVP